MQSTATVAAAVIGKQVPDPGEGRVADIGSVTDPRKSEGAFEQAVEG